MLKEPNTQARKTKKMLFKPAFESNGASMNLAIELLMVRLVLTILQYCETIFLDGCVDFYISM